MGDRWLGRRKEKRIWRKEEEIRNKGKKKKGGRKETRISPLAIFVKLNIRRFVWFWYLTISEVWYLGRNVDRLKLLS